jgi:hypothetical protein
MSGEQGTNKVQVSGVTLLSEKEYEQNRNLIPYIEKLWWLRSANLQLRCHADCVLSGGDTNVELVDKILGVRPALKCDLTTCGLTPGDKVVLNGQSYTALHGDYLLKDELIGWHFFHKGWCDPVSPNIFKSSDIKRYIDRWYENEFRRNVAHEEEMER